MGFNPHAKMQHCIKKKGVYIRRGRSSTNAIGLPRFMYLVETRKPVADTPAAMYWELHHFPHE